jgi:hypothetical protein
MSDRPQILVVREKHGNRYLPAATDEELHASALKLVTNRVEDGYWYYDDEDDAAATRASDIVQASDGTAAWRFLQERDDYEYEGVELTWMG